MATAFLAPRAYYGCPLIRRRVISVDFAVTKLGAKRVAIFFQNDQFGKDQRDGALEALKRHGLKPAAEASDVDVSAQAVAIKQAKPDAIILGVIP